MPPSHGAAHYADDAAAASEFLHGGRAPQAAEGAYDTSDPSRYDEALYGPADHGYDDEAHDDGYVAGAYPDQHGYGGGEAGRPRRGGMATVAALVALAVVGTAGAYGYRTMVATPRSSNTGGGDAPIIKADAGPNKIVPPTQNGDASGKQIQDRAPAGQGTERLVSREEQPVDVNAPGTARSGPRIVFPPLTTNPSAPASDATAAQQPARAPATPNSGLGEPRKIHTVAVRPDQPDATAAAPATAPAAKPVSTQRVSPSGASQAPAASTPLSLAPQASAPNTRVATTGPVNAPPAPAAAGTYMVQVASQKTEADAQASYRALQAKYPSVLGSRAPLIRRADLGDKGVHYQAMVGPFASRDEASQFCASYMSAGGQCFVPRK